MSADSSVQIRTADLDVIKFIYSKRKSFEKAPDSMPITLLNPSIVSHSCIQHSYSYIFKNLGKLLRRLALGGRVVVEARALEHFQALLPAIMPAVPA